MYVYIAMTSYSDDGEQIHGSFTTEEGALEWAKNHVSAKRDYDVDIYQSQLDVPGVEHVWRVCPEGICRGVCGSAEP